MTSMSSKNAHAIPSYDGEETKLCGSHADRSSRQPTRRSGMLLLLLLCEGGSNSAAAFRSVVTKSYSDSRFTKSLTASPLMTTASLSQHTCQTMQLFSARNRVGLEQRREGASPQEGGMTLYVKAGPDGTSLGDCPFAHFVRMVLEAKGLEYELIPSVPDTKPKWLIEYYEGKMPALRHRKECYVESDTIVAYLDFFFPKPELTPPNNNDAKSAEAAVEGLFPAIAKYVKHTPDGDEEDQMKRNDLSIILTRLNDHLAVASRTGPYMVGDGTVIRLIDCKIAPMMYHMCTAVPAFKGETALDWEKFPALQAYTRHMFEVDESFQKTMYPAEVITWGWGNARRLIS